MTRHQRLAAEQTVPTGVGQRKRLRLGAGFLLLSMSGFAQQVDLTRWSLEDLMNTKVTSVSMKEQSFSRTASAIFVITVDAIRRSGATNIPDLLRMVPGVDGAQLSGNTWAVSARGLNGRFSNELLVMLDGGNLYTPTFGGVFWDVLNLPLENVERIEGFRGPGGSAEERRETSGLCRRG
jgi:iron complex outermembrane receptor protein